MYYEKISTQSEDRLLCHVANRNKLDSNRPKTE